MSPKAPATTAAAGGDLLAPADTRTRLLQAAMAEFIEAGFGGTDTNRIARRAGFAPQTFYRWFADKTAIFIDVMQVWHEVECEMFGAVLTDTRSSDLALAEGLVEAVRPFLTFRRHLRVVCGQQPVIREARAQGRQALLAHLAALAPHQSRDHLGSLLVVIDMLSGAIAEGDLSEMGLADGHTLAGLASFIHRWRLPAP